MKLEGKLEDRSLERKASRRKLWLTVRHYWHRLLGTALGWFAWDFYYCASPLFSFFSPRTMTLNFDTVKHVI